MTENEFRVLNNFIIDKLSENNTFSITTSRFFQLINHDIRLSPGHNKLYSDFLECCEKYNAPFSVKSLYKSEDKDQQFDLLFAR